VSCRREACGGVGGHIRHAITYQVVTSSVGPRQQHLKIRSLGALCVKLVRWVKHVAVLGSFWDQSTQIAVDFSDFEDAAAIFGTTCVAKLRARHPKNANYRPCRMHQGR
jgi:hypothetical protein